MRAAVGAASGALAAAAALDAAARPDAAAAVQRDQVQVLWRRQGNALWHLRCLISCSPPPGSTPAPFPARVPTPSSPPAQVLDIWLKRNNNGNNHMYMYHDAHLQDWQLL